MMRYQPKIFYIIILIIVKLTFAQNDLGIKNAIEAERISEIKFNNIYPYFSSELLDKMSIYPGSVYDSLKVENQKIILTEFFRRKGYDSVNVNVRRERISDRLSKIHFDVLKSEYFTLDKIDITGNKYFSAFRLKKELRIYWRSFLPGENGRFLLEEFDAGKKDLENFYRDFGFADVEITESVIKDITNSTVKVHYDINEGPLYKITLTGTKFYSYGNLKKDTDRIYKGRRGTVAVRQIVRSIKQKYQAEGFNDVKIDWKEKNIPYDDHIVKEINISINEGERIVLSNINYLGNDSFTGSELKPYLNSVISRWWRSTDYFDKYAWEDDIRNITAFYGQNGFISSKINGSLKYSTDKDSVEIELNINEGIQTLINTVKCDSLDSIISDKERNKITSITKTPYNYRKIKDKTDYLKGLLATKGYLYASVDHEIIFNSDSSEVDIVFNATQGKIATTGEIYPVGNLKTDPETIKKLLQITPGSYFSILDMSKGQRNLRNQKIFRSVSVRTPGLSLEKDTLDILVNIEEYPSYYFQSSGGYESSMGPYLSALIGDKNIFGKNKEISLKGELSFTKQSATLGFIDPALFHPDLSGNFSTYWEREKDFNIDYETTILGIGTGLNYNWENNLQSLAQIQIENRELLEKTVQLEDSASTRNIGRLKLIHIWDNRDSFLLPKKGIYSTLETEFSTGINNNQDDFIRYKFDLKYFYSPFEFLTLAFSTKFNFIQEIDKDFQPAVDQLFYLGGTGTVRGIKENIFLTDADGNSVGGKLSALLSAEARIEFRKNWELPLFVDTGYIAHSYIENKDKIRTTVGSGLRYITPIGAMGILYGFPTDVKDSYKDGVFHFSLGYTF
ncbi:MAG: BamA/TamA family outer membrane protein [Candidatus Delongbacteria bacterium]|nr:BamA/TamA family outer membrane protein [Candidatus Delongbacteria bacterium]